MPFALYIAHCAANIRTRRGEEECAAACIHPLKLLEFSEVLSVFILSFNVYFRLSF